jgi:hypothetical protein
VQSIHLIWFGFGLGWWLPKVLILMSFGWVMRAKYSLQMGKAPEVVVPWAFGFLCADLSIAVWGN